MKRLDRRKLKLMVLLFIGGITLGVNLFVSQYSFRSSRILTNSDQEEEGKLDPPSIEWRISSLHNKELCMELAQTEEYNKTTLGVRLEKCNFEKSTQKWAIVETVGFPHTKQGYTRLYLIKSPSFTQAPNGFVNRAWNIILTEGSQYLIQRPIFKDQCIAFNERNRIEIGNCTTPTAFWAFSPYNSFNKSLNYND